jgi:FKBP-type peptidyl-prolyl cis-trans isomerase SlyD
MELKNQMVCSVDYKLQIEENGAMVMVDQTTSDAPLTFLMGSGQLLPQFESNLLGKRVGEVVSFKIDAENGYGLSNQEDIVAIPAENFLHPETGAFDEEIVKVGEFIPLQDQDGNQFNGKVVSINEGMVTIDFNHPLANKELNFEVTVLDIREASEEELAHGHAHGVGGHHH